MLLSTSRMASPKKYNLENEKYIKTTYYKQFLSIVKTYPLYTSAEQKLSLINLKFKK